MDISIDLLIRIAWFGAAILLILGLKTLYSRAVTRLDAELSASKKNTRKPGGSSAPAVSESATTLASAESVIIVPGYGMAVARAQHLIWELCKILQEKGVHVSFAINPVAGRLPGHMDILLAEAGVPYDIIFDLENINDQFPTCDVALLIGANDIVNPAARDDTSSPIYGMPILDAGKAHNVFIIKRGQGTGFSGIENPLFSKDNARMYYGDAKDEVQRLITDIESL